MKARLPRGVPVSVPNVKENMIKSNLLHIDGTDLTNCCIAEIHPEPFITCGDLGMTTMKMLTHTDNRTDQYSRYLREIIFRLYQREFPLPYHHQCGYPSKIKIAMTDTWWFQVKDAFNFQTENLYNQFEDVTHVLLTMCLRELDTSTLDTTTSCPTIPPFLGYDTVVAVVEQYHAKLFDNYMKWADFMRVDPFPWGGDKNDLPWRSNNMDLTQIVIEIILFKVSKKISRTFFVCQLWRKKKRFSLLFFLIKLICQFIFS